MAHIKVVNKKKGIVRTSLLQWLGLLLTRKLWNLPICKTSIIRSVTTLLWHIEPVISTYYLYNILHIIHCTATALFIIQELVPRGMYKAEYSFIIWITSKQRNASLFCILLGIERLLFYKNTEEILHQQNYNIV